MLLLLYLARISAFALEAAGRTASVAQVTLQVALEQAADLRNCAVTDDDAHQMKHVNTQ